MTSLHPPFLHIVPICTSVESLEMSSDLKSVEVRDCSNGETCGFILINGKSADGLGSVSGFGA